MSGPTKEYIEARRLFEESTEEAQKIFDIALKKLQSFLKASSTVVCPFYNEVKKATKEYEEASKDEKEKFKIRMIEVSKAFKEFFEKENEKFIVVEKEYAPHLNTYIKNTEKAREVFEANCFKE